MAHVSILSQLTDFFGFFTKKLRLSNPWNYKAPFLISVPYLVFLMEKIPDHASFFYILASISIIIGVAGIGYLTNDIGDKKKDALVSKENAASYLSLFNIIVLFTLFLTLTLLPWLYLPFDKISLCLLCFQFFLFCIYAFPPFRLKEKGISGVFTDSLYAHVNPAILASYTFYMLGYLSSNDIAGFLISLCLWQFVLGVRNIVFHQLKDLADDTASGTRTFVTSFGETKTIHLSIKYLLPLEVFFFIGFIAFISRFNYSFIPLILTYWIVILLKNRKKLDQLNFRDKAYLFLDYLYVKWLPLFILVILCFKSIYYVPVLILHFFIFRNDIKTHFLNNLNFLKS